jgi:predicted PilT family ATPase
VEGVETTHDAQNERAVLLPLLDQIRAQVGDLEAALAPALERQAKAERATIDIAGLAEVKKLAKREKVVKAKLEAVVEAAHKRTKELEAQARLQNRVAKEFAQDLDELFVNLGRGVSFFRD